MEFLELRGLRTYLTIPYNKAVVIGCGGLGGPQWARTSLVCVFNSISRSAGEVSSKDDEGPSGSTSENAFEKQWTYLVNPQQKCCDCLEACI